MEKSIFVSFVDSKQFDFVCSIGAKTQPESKCPELLANYCDMLLRKTPLSKKLTSEEVEKKLRDVVCKRLLLPWGLQIFVGHFWCFLFNSTADSIALIS